MITTAERAAYREALTRLSNTELIKAHTVAVTNIGPVDSPAYDDLVDVRAELLKRMEPYERERTARALVRERVAQTPVCPRCSADPLGWRDPDYAVCSNDACSVWSWDPRKPADQLDDAVILDVSHSGECRAEKRTGADKPDEHQLCTVRDCPGFGTRHGPMEY